METELQTAWRALDGKEGLDGWQTIRIAAHLPCQVLAARQHPGNMEALMVGFPAESLQPQGNLPGGSGFSLRKVDIGAAGRGLVWYALSRHHSGDSQLFELLAEDVLTVLSSCEGPGQAYGQFFKRLWSWLAFMKRSADRVLGHEAEIGLIGELAVLRFLLEAGKTPSRVVEAWAGPLDGPQDFRFGPLAVEVKTQVSPGRATVSISSLEQLDSVAVSPLFLTLVTLSSNDEGKGLAEWVTSVRMLLASIPETFRSFEDRLLRAGYVDTMADKYSHCYDVDQLEAFLISDDFPCLRRHSVVPEIAEAKYSIAIAALSAYSVAIDQVIEAIR